MPNIMMPNIVSQITPGKGVDPKAQVPVGKEGSFVQYLQNQIKANKVVSENVMGKAGQLKRNMPGEIEVGSEPPASVEALLQQVMSYLQKTLEKPNCDAGQWSFQLQDIGILEQLAGQAGMDLSVLALLKKQMEQQGGLPLADLFAAFERNFKELGEATKVTASETYLPLLDSFLARLGVTPEAIKQIDGQGVNGVDKLDLAAYLQGIKGISSSQLQEPQVQEQAGSSSFVLSDWEREQMVAMLTEAGVPSAVIDTMFPEVKTLEEKALSGLRLAEAGVPSVDNDPIFPEMKTPEEKKLGGLQDDQGDTLVAMTLERLQGILQKAIVSADEASPKANLPGFLEGLQLVLSQAGFQEEGVGWTPVVQGTMKAVYEQLLAMVHLATVKVEKIGGEREAGSSALPQVAAGAQPWNEGKHAEAMAENEALDQQWLTGSDDSSAEVTTDLSGDVNEALADSPVAVGSNPHQRAGEGQIQPGIEVRSVDPGVDPSAKLQPSRMRLTPELQQFAVEQISQGVLRGLRNNDQHLALTLYPKELGEVKVDLQIRGSHLSVTFVMENQKVKEAMEANMGDFKENLERRGFTLGEMSVSVDQHHRSPDEGRKFAKAWAEMIENQVHGKKNLTPPAVLAEMSQAGQIQSLHGGISLFV